MLPSKTEPQILYASSKSCLPKPTVCSPKRLAATEEANAYKISATASSIATMPKTVVVSGPLVRFSRKTSVVAAGAVAEEIAPKISPSAIEVAAFLVAA